MKIKKKILLILVITLFLICAVVAALWYRSSEKLTNAYQEDVSETSMRDACNAFNYLLTDTSYMATLGNRPDLFGDSDYVNRYYSNGSGGSYDIPPEALEDEAFAAIIKEAEKYLGFPYVWGGSSPATSFDCSGFVSYVYNNCGIGWSFGRLSAEGIRQICSYVSPADAKPGDLIFFEKTYNTTGASHIGIYVGNHTMLHCGDPIQYTSISSDYWQSHFLQFGRLAPP